MTPSTKRRNITIANLQQIVEAPTFDRNLSQMNRNMISNKYASLSPSQRNRQRHYMTETKKD